MSRTIRSYSPPEVLLSDEVRWVLASAFAREPDAGGRPTDPDRCLDAARRLGLSARVGSRRGLEHLTAEIGEPAATALRLDAIAAESIEIRLARGAAALAEMAEAVSVPLVFLKFMGLRLGGFLRPGSREAIDVDLLAPRGRAGLLYGSLVEGGYRPVEARGSERHLATLHHERHGAVEVHRIVLGVRIDGRRSATLAELESAGLLTVVGELPGRCYVPRREVLIAHAVVHAIAQHGHRPLSYPIMRMFSDLIDLGVGGEAGGAWRERIQPWIEREVAPAELDAIAGLCAALARGEPPATSGAGCEEPESLLLRHALAGATDVDYRRSLEIEGLRRALTDQPRALFLLRKTRSVLLPSRRQLQLQYGRSAGRWGTLRNRLRRVIDLLLLVVDSGRRSRLRRARK